MDKVVLFWKAEWLGRAYRLCERCAPGDRLSGWVLETCRQAIVNPPGQATREAGEVMLGRSGRSLRRMANRQQDSYWGYIALARLMSRGRAILRTTAQAVPVSDVHWWEYVPLLLSREGVRDWMSWNAWGRLGLPRDLFEWHYRFLESGGSVVEGRDVSIFKESVEQPLDVVDVWESAPVSVRTLSNPTGRFASVTLDGEDVTRLRWNRRTLVGDQ